MSPSCSKRFSSDNEAFGPFNIRVIEVKTTKPGVEVSLKSLQIRRCGIFGSWPVLNELSVTSIAHTSRTGKVPQVAARRKCDVRTFLRLDTGIFPNDCGHSSLAMFSPQSQWHTPPSTTRARLH